MKSERMAKRASFGNIVLKKLSDITNLQNVKVTSHEEKPPEMSEVERNCVDQLVMERRNLLKLIADRNKIIELSGAELKSLRVRLQKLQLQNWNLAQSNSQMLAEINSGRERVKALQHELMCRDALLKAKNLKQEGKTKAISEKTCIQEEVAMNIEGDIDDTEKPQNRQRRRNARSQSMGASTASQKVDETEKLENKRRGLKRQSARFKSHERELPTGNLFEIEDAKFRVDNSIDEEEYEASKRSSIGRPLRRAVVKVQSYKEMSLNVKMRREE